MGAREREREIEGKEEEEDKNEKSLRVDKGGERGGYDVISFSYTRRGDEEKAPSCVPEDCSLCAR